MSRDRTPGNSIRPECLVDNVSMTLKSANRVATAEDAIPASIKPPSPMTNKWPINGGKLPLPQPLICHLPIITTITHNTVTRQKKTPVQFTILMCVRCDIIFVLPTHQQSEGHYPDHTDKDYQIEDEAEDSQDLLSIPGQKADYAKGQAGQIKDKSANHD